MTEEHIIKMRLKTIFLEGQKTLGSQVLTNTTPVASVTVV